MGLTAGKEGSSWGSSVRERVVIPALLVEGRGLQEFLVLLGQQVETSVWL